MKSAYDVPPIPSLSSSYDIGRKRNKKSKAKEVMIPRTMSIFILISPTLSIHKLLKGNLLLQYNKANIVIPCLYYMYSWSFLFKYLILSKKHIPFILFLKAQQPTPPPTPTERLDYESWEHDWLTVGARSPPKRIIPAIRE